MPDVVPCAPVAGTCPSRLRSRRRAWGRAVARNPSRPERPGNHRRRPHARVARASRPRRGVAVPAAALGAARAVAPGRAHRGDRRGGAGLEHDVRRARGRQRLEDDEQRDDVGAGLRARVRLRHRRHRRLALQPGHRLGGDRRGPAEAQRPRLCRHRRLQVGRRGPDVAAHGPRGHAPHRQGRHRPEEPGHRLCRRDGALLDAEYGAGRVQDRRRRRDLDEIAVRRRPHRRDRPRHGPVRPEDPLREPVADRQRAGERDLQDDRRR